VLINCAVRISSKNKLVDMPVETIQKEINTNILGTFYTIKACLPGMQTLNRGHIVTISSALGYLGAARLCPSLPRKSDRSNLLHLQSRNAFPP
jgi:short-subunit dehydrogenase